MGMSSNFNMDKEVVLIVLRNTLFKSVVKMQELAKIAAPVDTGRLRNSIIFNPNFNQSDEYILIANVDYAAAIEFGTKPHHVSGDQLTLWAKRKLGDAGAGFAVSKKIAMFGTKRQPFMLPAKMQVERIWVKRFLAQELAKA